MSKIILSRSFVVMDWPIYSACFSCLKDLSPLPKVKIAKRLLIKGNRFPLFLSHPLHAKFISNG